MRDAIRGHHGTHLDERGHPWSSMALTRADGTPSALVLDFVLALELALELKLDGRSATCE